MERRRDNRKAQAEAFQAPARKADEGPVRVPRPRDVHVYSFACPRCDILLCDGVAYTHCPACDSTVDWVDLRAPIYACPGCDAMINAPRPELPHCARCKRAMRELHVTERPQPPWQVSSDRTLVRLLTRFFESPAGVALLLFGSLLPSLSLALDARWRWLAVGQILPAILIPLVGGVFIVVAIAWDFRELRALARDRATRVIHGIEHATVVVLLEAGFQVFGGETEPGFFKIWIDGDAGSGGARLKDDGTRQVQRACRKAISRLGTERWSLAINKRCGTAWLALFLLAGLSAIAAVGAGLLFTLEPRVLLAAIGAVFAVLIVGALPFGWLMQRWFTIDVEFTKANITRVTRVIEDGRVSCYCVQLDVKL